MKRPVKIILWIIAIVILVPVALIATLPLWLGPIARPSINQIAPKVVKTGFGMGRLYLNPYTGRFELGEMFLENHPGYSEKYAATVSNLVVDVDLASIGDHVIHIEELTVEDVFLSYISLNGTNNLDSIYWKFCGGKEKAEAKAEVAAEKKKLKAEKEEARRAKLSDEQRELEDAQQEFNELNRKRFCFDKVRITGIKVKFGFMPISVPSIVLENVGTRKDGITLFQLWESVLAAILKSAGNVVGDGAKFVGSLFGAGAGKAGEGAKKVGEGAADAAKKVGEGADKAVNAIKGLFGNGK